MIDDVATEGALAAGGSPRAIWLWLRGRRRKSGASPRGTAALGPANFSAEDPGEASLAAKVAISLLPDDNVLAGPLTSAARLIIELVPDRSG